MKFTADALILRFILVLKLNFQVFYYTQFIYQKAFYIEVYLGIFITQYSSANVYLLIINLLCTNKQNNLKTI